MEAIISSSVSWNIISSVSSILLWASSSDFFKSSTSAYWTRAWTTTPSTNSFKLFLFTFTCFNATRLPWYACSYWTSRIIFSPGSRHAALSMLFQPKSTPPVRPPTKLKFGRETWHKASGNCWGSSWGQKRNYWWKPRHKKWIYSIKRALGVVEHPSVSLP